MAFSTYHEIRPRVREWICNRGGWLKKLRPQKCAWSALIEIARRIVFELQVHPRTIDLRALEDDLASLGWHIESKHGDAFLVHRAKAIEAKPRSANEPVKPMASKRVVGELAEDAIREARPKLKTQKPRDTSAPIKTFADLVSVIQ